MQLQEKISLIFHRSVPYKLKYDEPDPPCPSRPDINDVCISAGEYYSSSVPDARYVLHKLSQLTHVLASPLILSSHKLYSVALKELYFDYRVVFKIKRQTYKAPYENENAILPLSEVNTHYSTLYEKSAFDEEAPLYFKLHLSELEGNTSNGSVYHIPGFKGLPFNEKVAYFNDASSKFPSRHRFQLLFRPKNLIYLPLLTRPELGQLTYSLTDHRDRPLNLSDAKIIVQMEIREENRMLDQFFLTINANTSLDLFSNNTSCDFYFQLPNSIVIDSRWQVALSLVICQKPLTKSLFKNLTENLIFVHCNLVPFSIVNSMQHHVLDTVPLTNEENGYSHYEPPAMHFLPITTDRPAKLHITLCNKEGKQLIPKEENNTLISITLLFKMKI